MFNMRDLKHRQYKISRYARDDSNYYGYNLPTTPGRTDNRHYHHRHIFLGGQI